MAPLKQKGDLAEMLVAADLVRRGYKVALPFGEDWDYDLIVERDGRLERVQVKYIDLRRQGGRGSMLLRIGHRTKGRGQEVVHRRDDRLAGGV